MSSELLIHNLIFSTSAVIALSLGVFVLIKNYKSLTHRLFFLNNLFYFTFSVFYLLGLSTSDHTLSKIYLFFTLINLFTVATTAHLALATFKLQYTHRWGIRVGYLFATLLTVFFIIFPDTYVLDSNSLLYFPNFYNPGSLYGLFVFFFAAEVCYFSFLLVKEYSRVDVLTKKRIMYFLGAFLWAYGIGSVSFLPVFGFNINPFPSALIGLYTIPLAYGLLKYQLLDIRVIAKKAVLYGFITSIIGFVLVITNTINNILIGHLGSGTKFTMPLIMAAFMVLIGWFVWKQMRGVDSLKYEFINNISHKFRTPLTHIRWLAEELRDINDQEQKNKIVEQIQFASMRLFELTNTVIDVARDNVNDYLYRFGKGNVRLLIETLCKTHEDLIKHKKLNMTLEIEPDIPEVTIDKTRLQFALQIILENALIYTPENGSINIKLRKRSNDLEFTIKDTGIGISPIELENIFSKFYRTQNARHADTEGMGIGLFMAKNIIEKHGGKIWAESEGENRGATFIFTIPLNKKV